MAEGHIVHPPALAGGFFDLVDTLGVLLCEWRGDKRDLAECK